MWFYHVGQAEGLELLTSGDPPISASHSARIIGTSHLAQPHPANFKFFCRDGIYVIQSGLKLLALSNPPASASQSADIKDVSHCIGPSYRPLDGAG